jgi:uncharacterized protein (DUF58 family)
MIPRELAKKIRYLEIYTSKAVNDILAGEYQSVFKGQGMEFEEVREYQPGDEVRSIDWNVTARMGHPFVKRFVEEREMTVMFLVDLSASGIFGSISRLKNEVAAEVCALLAFAAIKNNDKVGLIAFTDQIELVIPPAKGTSHVLRLIREILSFKPAQRGTRIAGGIEYLAHITSKRSVVFLISDFLDDDFEKPLRVASKKHDLIAVSVTDPREFNLPNVGLVELQDAENGRRALVDTGSAAVRKRYRQLGLVRKGMLKELFLANAIDHIEVSVDREDYIIDLVRFFRTRERRAAAGT